MKKFLSIFLALAMLLSLNIAAFAAGNEYDVTINYTPAITGITVTGNSSTTEEGYLEFADNDMMKVTVSGKNLDIATVSNAVYWGIAFSLDLKNTYSDYFTISEDGSTATFEFQYDSMSSYFPANYQMYYTNDGGTTLVETGIYIYCKDGAVAEITGMDITAGATYDSTSGVYNIAYKSTDDVVIQVNGKDLNRADGILTITLPSGNEVVALNNGWTYDGAYTSATKSFSVGTFSGCTTVFTVQYAADGTNFVDGLKILQEVANVAVDIEWGTMKFTYEKGDWTAEGNTVTISTSEANNVETIDVSAGFAFNDDAAELGITYNWDTDASVLSDESGSCTFTLNLSGKPSKAFDGTIGTITLTIEEGSDAE